jgi:hypothetical protein
MFSLYPLLCLTCWCRCLKSIHMSICFITVIKAVLDGRFCIELAKAGEYLNSYCYSRIRKTLLTDGYRRGGFLASSIEQFLKLDLSKWLKVIRDLELMPKLLNQDWSSVFLQQFGGNVTIIVSFFGFVNTHIACLNMCLLLVINSPSRGYLTGRES